MKIKRLFALIIVMGLIMTTFVPVSIASNPSDFTVENGVLTDYIGTDTVITIPDTVTSIGTNAFEACAGLTSITIPNSVTSISAYSFSGCTGLTSITIPSSVISYNGNTFNGCTRLTQINVDNNNLYYSSQDGVVFNKTATSLMEYPIGKTGSYVIPNSVSNISYSSFYECTGLTSLTIPGSVTSIDNSAFYGCAGLTQFIVDSNNLTYSSQDGILFNKTVTSLIQYPGNKTGSYVIPESVIDIADSAFYGCLGLTSVSIGNGVTSVGDYAFAYCTGLTSVTMGSGGSSIGEHAFTNCSGLTKVNFGSGVTSINGYAFYGCALINVVIPDSVTSIGNGAFASCFRLTSATFGNGVTSIGDTAFGGCSSLIGGVFLGNAPTMGSDVFASSNYTFKVYYVSGNTGFTNPWCGYTTTTETFVNTAVIDLANFEWARVQIQSLVESGVVNGESSTSEGIIFAPQDQITRAELTKLIVNAYNIQGNGVDASFNDVASDAWYYDVVGAAFKSGIITGTSKVTFEPEKPITRQDMSTIIIRAMVKCQSKSLVDDSLINVNLAAFNDADEIADYARVYIATAAKLGIIHGTKDEGPLKFKPMNNTNRAEAAVVIFNMLNTV